MKTHISNTQALKLKNDVVAHQHFLNHQRAINSNVKPVIDNKRKQEIKIVRNKKNELNTNPKAHVNKLYSNLFNKQYKSTLDNKAKDYEQMKGLLADKIKKNKYEKFAESEHQRQIRSMKNRISNCKNMQQRKKDNTDPIVNPTYFIKHGQEVASVTIDGYCKKVLGMNRPQTGITRQPPKIEYKQLVGRNEEESHTPPNQMYGKVPSYTKERPKTANVHGRGSGLESKLQDLPGCTFKQILNHIVNNKLFRDVELKVLYVRLCHRYGQQYVEQIWQQLMDELQR